MLNEDEDDDNDDDEFCEDDEDVAEVGEEESEFHISESLPPVAVTSVTTRSAFAGACSFEFVDAVGREVVTLEAL